MFAMLFGGLEILFLLFLLPLSLLSFVFWIWMLVDCATKEKDQGNTKIIWILIIIFTHFIGGLLYLLIRRPQRIQELGR